MSSMNWRRFYAVLVLVTSAGAAGPALRSVEVRTYLDRKVREIAMRDHLGPVGMQRLRDALTPRSNISAGKWTTDAAVASVMEAVRKNQLGFTRDRRLVRVVRPTQNVRYDSRELRELATQFVRDVFSDVRRQSVLDEIGRGPEEQLTASQLSRTLEVGFNMSNFKTVTDSFDTELAPVTAKILDRDMTLPRLIGGTSGPLGRYFFCCLWERDAGTSGLWSDASWLALPPENTKEGLALVTIPAGTTAFVGVVGDNFLDALGVKQKGGNIQLYIPNLGGASVRSYERAPRPLADILINSDEGVLPFRATPELRETGRQ